MVVATMGLTVVLWIFGDAIGMSSVTAAMLGMSLQLLSGVITWQDCLNEKGAWDTLLWFAVLIGMSSQLNQMGFITFLSNAVAGALSSLALGWQQVFVLLHACYFVIHYLFASQTAQVAALSTAFMAMMIASGAPPVLAGLTMAFHTNLFGGAVPSLPAIPPPLVHLPSPFTLRITKIHTSSCPYPRPPEKKKNNNNMSNFEKLVRVCYGRRSRSVGRYAQALSRTTPAARAPCISAPDSSTFQPPLGSGASLAW